MKRYQWLAGWIPIVYLMVSVNAQASPLVFVCAEENDLFQIVARTTKDLTRVNTIDDALAAGKDGTALLILADGYPQQTTTIPQDFWKNAQQKRLRVYVEYPNQLPGLELGKPQGTKWERLVIADDWFGAELPSMQILMAHDCYFTPVHANAAHIVAARVAGYDTAVYSLPDETYPILFELPDSICLVATTKLSQLVTGRYAPYRSWRLVWKQIFQWLRPNDDIPTVEWVPVVRPMYAKDAPLADDAERRAFEQGMQWFRDSKILLPCSREEQITKQLHEGIQNTDQYAAGWMEFESAPPPEIGEPGDGTCGILEGYSARIRYDGVQPQRLIRRADCVSESAMAFAFESALDKKPESGTIASNLQDYIYIHSDARQGVRNDPQHPAYGLVSWGMSSDAWVNTFYGDDDARVMLGTMATAALLKSDQWDQVLLDNLLANLRTTGPNGFRPNAITVSDLEKNGWKYYHEWDGTVYSPHYQCYLWACYLWAYQQTGYKPFLERAKTAIRMTMDAYPQEWFWTLSMVQERARMLLPLSWLIRVEDTPEHREWLKRIAIDMLKYQDACGALQEVLETPSGSLRPPKTNQEYGLNEATLIQHDGDPAADMLYTCNFAFLGLHEAAAATGDPLYAEAEQNLANFLCRIQVQSEKYPYLHGAWFRAFDFKRWEYWASAADVGWGAWCIESGWKQAWIVSVLAMRQMDTSLWELTQPSAIEGNFDQTLHKFLED